MLLICGSRDRVLSRVTPKIGKTIWNPNTASSQSYCRRPCSTLQLLDVPKYATADLLGLSTSPLSQNQYCNDATQPCRLSKAVSNSTIIHCRNAMKHCYRTQTFWRFFVGIWRFDNFQDGGSPPSWILGSNNGLLEKPTWLPIGRQ